jgi:hypothetical protein
VVAEELQNVVFEFVAERHDASGGGEGMARNLEAIRPDGESASMIPLARKSRFRNYDDFLTPDRYP